MKHALAIVLASLLASLANADEYSIEPVADGTRAIIKGEDGVERAVIVISPEHYDLLTNRMETTWRMLNATHESRCRLHGKPTKSVEIDEARLVKRTVYADGYIYEEPFQKKEPRKLPPTLLNVEVAPRRPASMSARQWNALKARERAEKAKAREVTVEFAPGGKVISTTKKEIEK